MDKRLEAPMKLLTKEILDKLPPLYSQENVKDPMVWVKFFTPDAGWTWYGIEFDGKDIFFGLVIGFEPELGYFSLRELKSVRGKFGLPIERDMYFTPKPLSQVKGAEHILWEETIATRPPIKKTTPKLTVFCFENKDRSALEPIPYAVIVDDDYYTLTAPSPNARGCGTYFRAGKLSLLSEPRASRTPKSVEHIGGKTIKHYRSADSMHKGSIRVLKHPSGTLVYLGCPKSQKWEPRSNICSKQVVLKTVELSDVAESELAEVHSKYELWGTNGARARLWREGRMWFVKVIRLGGDPYEGSPFMFSTKAAAIEKLKDRGMKLLSPAGLASPEMQEVSSHVRDAIEKTETVKDAA